MNTIVDIYGETYDLADIKYIKKIYYIQKNSEIMSSGRVKYWDEYVYGIKIHFHNIKPVDVWSNSESQRDESFLMLIKIMNKVKAKRGY